MTRLASTGLVDTGFQVDDRVLAALPGRGRARLTVALRLLLGAVGVAQFLLGAAQIARSAGAGHLHTVGAVTASMPSHLWHESAAWNVAVGAGFGWIALRRTRPAGILPTLTAFVAVLSLLSVNDMIANRVDLGRIASHGFIVVGYLLLVALSRATPDPGEPPADRQTPRWTWRARFDDDQPTHPRPSLRLINGTGEAHTPARGCRAA